MENATKALLIAAAVLIAILIISFGVFIISSVNETIHDSVDMSDLEIQQFNQKFKNYEGPSVAGSRVKSLIQTIKTHNMTETEDSKKVHLYSDASASAEIDLDNSGIQSGYRYNVTCIEDKNSALITKITIVQNSGTTE